MRRSRARGPSGELRGAPHGESTRGVCRRVRGLLAGAKRSDEASAQFGPASGIGQIEDTDGVTGERCGLPGAR